MELIQANKRLQDEIAEREQAEQKFRGLLESAPDAIVILNSRGRIILVNRQVEAWFGYTHEELLGQPVDVLIPERYRERHAVHMATYLESPRTRPMGTGMELYGRRKDGSEVPVEISLSPLKTVEGTLVTAIVRDITEHKKVEQDILELNQALSERTSQLEEMNKELAAFSYSVSHDLKAPLRAIDGFSQALLEDYEETLDADGKEHLRRIRSAAQHMGNLIDDMLVLSRVTRAELNRQEVDMRAMVEEIFKNLRRRDPSRPVELDLSSDLRVSADARLLHIALVNLLDNAWKFTQRRNPGRIVFGMTERNGKPAYFIQDNGVGFDMTYADKLFQAFQRLHDAREFPGTGIGLAIVQRVIHKHGGLIWAESELGHGAVFYFTLS